MENRKSKGPVRNESEQSTNKQVWMQRSHSDQKLTMEVEALNIAGAQVGDRIVLHIETASLLKASFLLYVFPILCMLLGALLGHHGAPSLQLDPSLVSVVLGLVGFGMAFAIIRRRQQSMARTNAYKPKIIRIVQRA